MENSGEQFLHKKDPKLHTASEVEHEMERKKTKGEKTSQKPADKIADYLEVIKRTHTGHREDPEVMERIRDYYHREYTIKPEDIPESYYENQRRLAREQGHSNIEITDQQREQLVEVIIKDQQTTLDNWINYFTSPDADAYPMWAKYWAFTNMLKLSTFDKEKHTFAKRDKSTVAPFPDLNREALAYVVDAIIKKANNEKVVVTDNNPELKQLLDGANFGKLYVYAIEKVTPTEKNELENTKGEWVKYEKGSDHMLLVKSLQGYGTGWCTAGESTAQSQLESGDFYVYYSNNKDDISIIPRVAIRMQGNSIGEVRGIAKEQNLDQYIGDVAKEKLKEFPDGKQYEKKSADMRLLTEIENKTNNKKPLTKDDVTFLYEINFKIEGFGYDRDPRIKEIKDKRNIKEDFAIIYDCSPEQVAMNYSEIRLGTNKDTLVVYIPGLKPGNISIDAYKVDYHLYYSSDMFEILPDKARNILNSLSKIVGLSTDLSSFPDEEKDSITSWKGSLVDHSVLSLYKNLQNVDGTLMLGESYNKSTIETPNLITIGENLYIDAENFKAPKLKSVGGILSISGSAFEMPRLQTVGTALSARDVTDFKVPSLQTCGQIEAYSAVTFEAPNLIKDNKSWGSFIGFGEKIDKTKVKLPESYSHYIESIKSK